MTQLSGSSTTQNWSQQLCECLALSVDEPTEFLQGEEALVAELMPVSDDVVANTKRSEEILREAQDIYATAEDRAAGATTRATTLQGAVAIATSLLLAGSALVFGQAKLHGTGWRIGFALLLLAVTFSLVMTGLRALSASSTIHRWHRPTAQNIVIRARLPVPEANIRLAAETLVDYSYNTKIAAWKVSYLGAAAWWFRLALGAFVALAVLLAAYTVFGPQPATGAAKTGIPATEQKQP